MNSANPDQDANDRTMRLRFAGRCHRCGTRLDKGTRDIYARHDRTVRCVTCPDAEQIEFAVNPDDNADHVPSAQGVAGASARREHQRRKARDEQRLRAKWGRLGGVAVALAPPRTGTQVWERGAIGEEHLGARLNATAGHDIAVVHDVRIPGTGANTDHIVVTRSAVWVIDGALKQVSHVRARTADVPVVGVMCFLDAAWPLFGGDFEIRDIRVLWPKKLIQLISQDARGPLNVEALRATIMSGFRFA